MVGLDRTGMVVALDLERHSPALADVYHPGVRARSGKHPVRGSRERGEQMLGRFVGAMLTPHASKNGELGPAGQALQRTPAKTT